MRVLLHTCCAVCLSGPCSALSREGKEVTPFFYNPNIHPFLEFRKRLKAVEVLAEAMKIPARYDDTYDLELFFRTVLADLSDRCRLCYRLRLRQTALCAAETGVGAFATTLAASPHQKHDILREEGEQAADDFSVEFVYRDWRALHPENVESAKKRSLYRQQYCGCVWSEQERYRDTSKELYGSDRRVK